MAKTEKKKRAALVAVAYYLKEESINAEEKKQSNWLNVGRKVVMNNSIIVQRRGRVL